MDYSCQDGKSIILSTEKQIIQIFIKDITFIESDSYLSIFHFYNDDKTETFSIILKEFESFLTQYCFFRINKQILLNLRYLQRIERDRSITLRNNSKLSISHRKLTLFRQYIFSFGLR